jgi:predicted metal-dependent peptidase
MHPALQHHVRRSGRDPRRWNEACDYAINPLLLDAGLSLPDGVLVDHRFRGMSAEQIYNLRNAEAHPQSGGQNSSDAGAGTGAGETPEKQGSPDERKRPKFPSGLSVAGR